MAAKKPRRPLDLERCWKLYNSVHTGHINCVSLIAPFGDLLRDVAYLREHQAEDPYA